MKTIKSLITLLLLMVGMTTAAQTVVIEKTDGTSDEFPAAEVDSVVYNPGTDSSEKVYGYYSFGVNYERGREDYDTEAEILLLSEDDFTPLTSETGQTAKPRYGSIPVFLVPEESTITFKWHSTTVNAYCSEITGTKATSNMEIKGIKYDIWFDNTKLSNDVDHVAYTISN